MRVLVFRHIPFEGLGLLEPALAARGVAYDYCDLYASGSALPDADGYGGFIFMGGPMSANDELPFLAQEMRLIERAAARGTPLLGICLGSQMIARALGGRVYRNEQKEIGWFEIELTAAGLKDPMLGQLAQAETVFHWHSDTFDLPRGAEWLASSQRTRNQAYRIERSIYGLQFHLEVTPEMIVDWSRATENFGDIEALESPLDPWVNHARSRDSATAVFGRWCDILEPSDR